MQILDKFIFWLIFCLSAIDVSIGLSQKEMCDKDNKNTKKILNFRVDAAFKFHDYLGLVGDAYFDKGDTKRVAIRTMYWHQPDPSGRAPDQYFDAMVWNELRNLDSQNKIRMAFSTSSAHIFEQQFQFESSVVFLVQSQNLTTAYQFEQHQVERMTENSTWQDLLLAKKVVYDPQYNWDDSGFLRIKYLYLHFPPELKILGILIFDRKKLVWKKAKDVHFYVPNWYPSQAIHHAIVYTEEKFEEKVYYFRHYLRTERHLYKESNGESTEALDWFFDENIDFCDEIQKAPTAVSLLRKEMETVYLKTTDEYKLFINFIEFYGVSHKVMKIVFPSVYYDNYTIEEENGEIDNAVAFTHCEPHPIFNKTEHIPCQDYPLPKDFINSVIRIPKERHSEGWTESMTNFIFVGIFIAIVLFVILVGLCVMVVLKK